MIVRLQNWLDWIIGFGWVTAMLSGLVASWRYENSSGTQFGSPAVWPQATRVKLAADRPTLVMFLHPRCLCSRASLQELAAILAQGSNQIAANVLFYKPLEESLAWVQTDIWQKAVTMPGVQLALDEENGESETFGIVTAGQVVLYDTAGRLHFSGVITAACCPNSPTITVVPKLADIIRTLTSQPPVSASGWLPPVLQSSRLGV